MDMQYPTAPWLSGATIDYKDKVSRDLLSRWGAHHAWWEDRYRHGADAYSKSTAGQIRPRLHAYDRKGQRYTGVNFASQDYLNLSSHLDVCDAAVGAIRKYGVHSAGSAALMGNTLEANQLEKELAAFLRMRDCTLFSTGWSAGYGVVKTLVHEADHIVIDLLAHACLQDGAREATRYVHQVRHCSTQAVETRLQRIRIQHPEAGILVVTEGLFSMDSDAPDLAALQALATRYGATLLVDVAHDLGALGPGGTGTLGAQGMLGKVDVVMGSFSKTFASNGGFVASNSDSLKLALRYNCGPLTFTNAMSPVAARTVRESLAIVRGTQGEELRARMQHNAIALRTLLQEQGFEVLGQPSAIVPVILGDSALSRLMTRHALRMGAIVNLVEYPAVSRNTCRWRLQVMAHHSERDLRDLVAIACEARALAKQELAGAPAEAEAAD